MTCQSVKVRRLDCGNTRDHCRALKLDSCKKIFCKWKNLPLNSGCGNVLLFFSYILFLAALHIRKLWETTKLNQALPMSSTISQRRYMTSDELFKVSDSDSVSFTEAFTPGPVLPVWDLQPPPASAKALNPCNYILSGIGWLKYLQ